MICSKCGSTIPLKAKFCPECGATVQTNPVCKNGHKMQIGQKFCCECGSPAMVENDNDIQTKSDPSKSVTKPTNSSSSKVEKFIVKAIATIVVLGIAIAIITAIGGVPSYIIGGICFVILPNIWEFIDDY